MPGLRLGMEELADLDQTATVHGVQHGWFCDGAEVGRGAVATVWERGEAR